MPFKASSCENNVAKRTVREFKVFAEVDSSLKLFRRCDEWKNHEKIENNKLKNIKSENHRKRIRKSYKKGWQIICGSIR